MSKSPPFECCLIFGGGSFNFTIHLGMLAGVRHMGYEPDLLIGTCGGGLACAVINRFPSSDDQKAFIQTKDFFDFIHTVKPNRLSIPYLMSHLIRMQVRYLYGKWTHRPNTFIPNFLEKSIFRIDDPMNLVNFQKPFSSTFPRLLMTAGKILIDPHTRPLQNTHQKILKEVFFTDDQTASFLENFKSNISRFYPDSFLIPETETIMHWTADLAARAAIADPFLINPFRKEGTYYLSGSINLYPLELARHLSKKIIIPYSPRFGFIDQVVLRHFYGYDNIERYTYITAQAVDHWVDFTDYTPAMKDHGFEPVGDYLRGKILHRVPKDLNAFRKYALKQWEYGFYRAQEALKHLFQKITFEFPNNE